MNEQLLLFIEAYGRKPVNIGELNDFITQRRLQALDYRNFIYNHLNTDVLELNKQDDDTIVYGTTIKTISPYKLPKEYVYKRGLININNGKLIVNNFIVPNNYQLITQNPYDLSTIYNLCELKDYDLLIGVYGNIKDDDLFRKLETIRSLKDYFEIFGVDSSIEEKSNNKEYYSYIYTKRVK